MNRYIQIDITTYSRAPMACMAPQYVSPKPPPLGGRTLALSGEPRRFPRENMS